MAGVTPSRLSVRVAVREAQRSMFSGIDEGEDFRDRRVCIRQMPHRVQTLGKYARAVKQLLVKGSYDRKAFAREFTALHADDVEALEACILAVGQPERDHVAANSADASDHHLRPDPRELMHRRQAADENKITDLTMAAQRRRGCENDIVTDDAVMTHMAA